MESIFIDISIMNGISKQGENLTQPLTFPFKDIIISTHINSVFCVHVIGRIRPP